MKIDWFVKFLLLVIVILLGVIALRLYVAPPVVKAESLGTYFPLHIEPGNVNLTSPDGKYSGVGKLVIDLRNGNIWGFPALGTVPRSLSDFTPITSHPYLVGKWALTDMDK